MVDGKTVVLAEFTKPPRQTIKTMKGPSGDRNIICVSFASNGEGWKGGSGREFISISERFVVSTFLMAYGVGFQTTVKVVKRNDKEEARQWITLWDSSLDFHRVSVSIRCPKFDKTVLHSFKTKILKFFW